MIPTGKVERGERHGAVTWDQRPDRRTRRAYLHLQYSYAAPFGPTLLVTQDPLREVPVLEPEAEPFFRFRPLVGVTFPLPRGGRTYRQNLIDKASFPILV
jgi:hypothetical protein